MYNFRASTLAKRIVQPRDDELFTERQYIRMTSTTAGQRAMEKLEKGLAQADGASRAETARLPFRVRAATMVFEALVEHPQVLEMNVEFMLRKVDSIRRDVVDLGLHEHTQTAELMPRLEAAMYRLETRLGRTPVCVVHLSSTHRRAQTTFHGVVRSGVLRVGQKIRNSTRVVAVSADEAWPGERVEFAVDHEIVLPNELVFLV